MSPQLQQQVELEVQQRLLQAMPRSSIPVSRQDVETSSNRSWTWWAQEEEVEPEFPEEWLEEQPEDQNSDQGPSEMDEGL